MQKGNKKMNSGGLSLPSVLLVIFIVLKLCHVIDWSWVWVLSPFWITLAVVLPIVFIAYKIGG